MSMEKVHEESTEKVVEEPKVEAKADAVKMAKKKLVIISAISAAVIIFIAAISAGAWSIYMTQMNNGVTSAAKKTLHLPVGMVDGKLISFSTFDKRVAATQQFFKKQEELKLGLAQDPGVDEVRKQEFARLVDGVLLDVIAKDKKVTVSKEDVDKYFTDNILPQAQGGIDEVTKTLTDLYGWSVEDFKTEVLTETVLRTKVQAVLSGDDSENSDVKTTIEQIAADVKAGTKSFEEEAKNKSDDTGSAAQDGKLGSISKGQTVKEFEDVAFATPVGSVSEPFKSQYGWHILKVTAKDEKAETVEVSHILIAGKQIQDVIDAAREKASISSFVKGLYTKDDATAVTNTNTAAEASENTNTATETTNTNQ